MSLDEDFVSGIARYNEISEKIIQLEKQRNEVVSIFYAMEREFRSVLGDEPRVIPINGRFTLWTSRIDRKLIIDKIEVTEHNIEIYEGGRDFWESFGEYKLQEVLLDFAPESIVELLNFLKNEVGKFDV